MTPQCRRSDRAFYLALACSSAPFYLAFILRTSFVFEDRRVFTLFDDAMISMRYAQNLAAGHGLVFNAGEPAVEGYTNLLWTLWMAAIHRLPLDESKLPLAVMLCGLGILFANLWAVRRIAERLAGGSTAVTRAAVCLTAFHYPLIFWTLRGMEVGLLTLVVDLAVLDALDLAERFATGRLLRLCGLAALAALIRPDGVVPFVVIALFAAVHVPRRAAAAVGALTLSLAATVAANTVFRIEYYGQALPNTYYLKMTGGPALARVAHGFAVFVGLCLAHLFAPLIAAAAAAPRRRDPTHRLLAAVFLSQCAFSIYVGGDAWEFASFANRYVTVGMPALLVLAASGLSAIARLPERRLGRLAAAAFGFLGVVLLLQGSSLFGGTGRFRELVHFDRYPLLPRVVAALSILLGATTAAGWIASLASPRVFVSFLTASRSLLGTTEARRLRTAAGLVLLLLNGPDFVRWATDNGIQVEAEKRWAEIGLRLRRMTTPRARLAVVTAGTIPYFSRRAVVDLLGKSDPVIAEGPRHGDVPQARLRPGHDKWNYAHSVGRLRPDVIVQLWHPTDDDFRYIESLGYERLANSALVATDSREVDRAALAALDLFVIASAPGHPRLRAPIERPLKAGGAAVVRVAGVERVLDPVDQQRRRHLQPIGDPVEQKPARATRRAGTDRAESEAQRRPQDVNVVGEHGDVAEIDVFPRDRDLRVAGLGGHARDALEVMPPAEAQQPRVERRVAGQHGEQRRGEHRSAPPPGTEPAAQRRARQQHEEGRAGAQVAHGEERKPARQGDQQRQENGAEEESGERLPVA